MTELMHFPFLLHELTAPSLLHIQWVDVQKSKMNSDPFLCKIMFLEYKMIHFLKYVSGESLEETNQTNAH